MEKTKKLIFWITFLIVASFWIVFLITDNYCYDNRYGLYCGLLSCWAGASFFALPVFVFSSITYFLRGEVFQKWFRFSAWWIPMSLFFTLITQESGGGFAGWGWGKQDTALVFLFLYSVISLILVIYKTLSLKFGKK